MSLYLSYICINLLVWRCGGVEVWKCRSLEVWKSGNMQMTFAFLTFILTC